MRHLRPFAALLAMAAVTIACSGPPGSSSGAASQGGEASQGGGASQPAASSGGGGGGGTGSNGSASYQITGDASKSGDLGFTYIGGGLSQFVNGGWIAYFYSEDTKTVITINSNPQSNIVVFGDEEIVVTGTGDTGCTFNYSQNDASGLKGTIDCANTVATTATGTQIHVDLHVTVDAHT